MLSMSRISLPVIALAVCVSILAGATATQLQSGAIALAIGDTSDTCWKIASVNGARPNVTAHCTAPHWASMPRGSGRDALT